MSVIVVCPNPQCAAKSSVPDEWLGRRTKCSRCGQRFSPQIRSGESKKEDTDLPTAFGRFQILEKLGSGAFGTVYKAYDPQLDREVALKVPHAGMLDSPKRVQRFLGEARAAARLRHPHIVPVFDAGPDGDGAYIAAAYIPGGPLASALAGGGLELRRAARLTRELAEALAYAHSEGIVHRDVKSANVLLDPHDHTHLTDFGLAIRLDQESRMTQDGTVLGTPSYMAPEQASGKLGEAGPASDQYSLGAVLYELLTGRTPFEGPPQVVLFHAVHTLPTSPQNLRPAVPKDLETICLKALAKQPDERYRDCQALADDLRRWLDGEPIAARPLGGVERLVRWSRRNPIIASLGAAVALSLLLGSVVSLYFAVRAANSAADARTKATEAANHAQIAETEKERAREEETNARAAERVAKLMTGQLALDRGLMLCEQGDVDSGMHWLARSLELLPADAKGLHTTARRNIAEWQRFAQAMTTVFSTGNTTNLATFLPDSNLIFAGGLGEASRPWDLYTGKPVGTQVYQEGGTALACSPDGRHAISNRFDYSSEAAARLWDLHNESRGLALPHPNQVATARFGSDSQTVLTLDVKQTIRRWNVKTGQLLGEPIDGQEIVAHSVFLGPEGKRIIAAGWGGVQSWDAATGKPEGPLLNRNIFSAALTPDGKTIILGSRDRLTVWNVETRKDVATLYVDHCVRAIAISPDQTVIATGDAAGVVRFWEARDGVPTGQSIGPPWHNSETLISLAFSPDGGAILACTLTGTVRHRRLARKHQGRQLFEFPGVWVMTFTPDKQAVLCGGFNKHAQIFSATTGKPLGQPIPLGDTVDLAVNSDGSKILFMTNENGGGFWDVKAAKLLIETQFKQGGEGIFRAAWSPNERSVLVSTWRSVVEHRDGATLKEIGKPIRLGSPITAMAFSPDSKVFLLGTEHGQFRIYETATGNPIGLEHRLPGPVKAAVFLADGKSVRTACANIGVFTWRVDEQTTLIDQPLQHASSANEMCFNRDGSMLLTGSRERGVRLWDLRTGKPITAFLKIPGEAQTIAFHPDGQTFLAGSPDGRVWSWNIPRPVEGTSERITTWIESLTGQTMDAAGNIRALTPSEWQAKRQRLTELGGPPLK